MKFEYIKTEELITDPSFIAFVQKTDPEKVEYWKKVIDSHPHNREAFDEAISIINSFMLDISDNEVDKANIDLKHAILASQTTTNEFEIDQNRTRHSFWYRYAAILTVFLMAAFLLYYFIDKQNLSKNTISDATSENWIVKQTSKGQKSTIVLKDGSHIRLNSESKIMIPEIFSKEFREVKIEGEVYFDVSHDPLHPFVVYSNNTITKAFGTSFNIKSYPEIDYTSIALVEGKVSVTYGENSDSILLVPNELLKVSKTTQKFSTETFDPYGHTCWKEGIIRFHESNFDEIIKALERWYDVTFEIRKYPTVKAFSGEFDNDSLEEVLKGISFSLEFDYKLDDKTVYIN